MARQDLLALTSDDLVLLANRGLVKRAGAELASSELQGELAEDAAGNVQVRWSDGVECLLPANRPVGDGRCTCPATSLCRHLIRSVLLYQQTGIPPTPCDQQEAASTDAEVASTSTTSKPIPDPPGAPGAIPTHENHAPPDSQPAAAGVVPAIRPRPEVVFTATIAWDPGTIDDQTLAAHVHRSTLARARTLLAEGQGVELARGVKPHAYLHTVPCTVRFLVPGDLRYAHCDCGESTPCAHVAIAVWSYRLLAADAMSGLISTGTDPCVPTALLEDIEAALLALAGAGIANAPRALMDRFRRLEARCRAENLVWPAEILAELVAQHGAYAAHDARFSLAFVAVLVGELCVRLDAIRANTGAVPQLFVRGAQSDSAATLGSARLIGLGCGVRVRRGVVELAAYMQDAASGTVLAITRETPDPAPDAPNPPEDYWRLAARPLLKGASPAALASGQLLVKGGKRTPEGRFLPGRAPFSFNPQAFAWESLRPPVLAEDLAALTAHLAGLPPLVLRPRRLSANLAVCPVVAADVVRFDTAEQAVVAIVRDAEGGSATLIHPYTTRGRAGAEALLTLLRTRPTALRFVAGAIRAGAAGLQIAPISIIYDDESGVRRMLQPWVDRWLPDQGEPARAAAWEADPAPALPPAGSVDPLRQFQARFEAALGELFLLGMQDGAARTARDWQELRGEAASLGFARLLRPLDNLAQRLAQRSHTLQWDEQSAIQALLTLSAIISLLQEG